MKCRYTFAVVSEAALDPSLRFKHKNVDYTLVSEKGRFSAIVIEVSGIHFPKPPNITHPAGSLPTVNIPGDPMLDIIQTELRTIRGALCLWMVHDVDVDSPKIDWIPETEEEKKSTDVFGFSQKKTPRGQGKPQPIAQDMLVRSIIAREKMLLLQIPLEFLRRGWDDIFHQACPGC